MNIKAVVFDLFETLVTVQNIIGPYRRVFELAQKSGHEFAEIRRVLLTTDLPRPADIATSFGLESFENERFLLDIEAELQSVRLFSEVPDVLKWLKEEGYRIGLISNLASPYKKAFYDVGLDDFIDKPVFSCDVGSIKPEPQICEVARARLDAQFNEMLMVGDNLIPDVEGPRAVGMHALQVQRAQPTAGSIRSLDELCHILHP